MNIARISRRIGLGGVDEFIGHNNSDDIIESAINAPVTFLGIPTIGGSIEKWPANKEFDLNNRIQRLVARRSNEDAIDKKKLPDNERDKEREKNWRKYSVDEIDKHRFFHAGQYAQNQIKLRLSYFWLNHFTVGSKETTPQLISDYWEQVILKGLDGSFADLLYDAITHPAMLTYLDNIYNIGPNSPKAKSCGSSAGQASCVVGLNDNLGRELLELHTVSPAVGYTEQDITDCAKILAGWGNIFDKNGWSKKPSDFRKPWDNYQSEPGKKEVLAQKIPSGKKGLRVLTDFLADHEQTKKFITKKILTHFCGAQFASLNYNKLIEVWNATGGDLREIHKTALQLSLTAAETVFLWPTTWCFQVSRLTGANIVSGFNEIGIDNMRSHVVNASWIMSEMGHDFWSERQPNGFSDIKSDWISTEHFDRRIRYAGLLFDYGRPSQNIDSIISKHIVSAKLKSQLSSISKERTRFIATLCSPEILEV